ncbi:MAG: tyrosine-protein phosphatase [Kiritimatiellae bacterium]|nr:tyrosine-protein phosphatase [Kiritimatiellia bacterium]
MTKTMIGLSLMRTMLCGMVFCAVSCQASVELLAPTNGAVIALVPDAQKKVLALPTTEDRLQFFSYDRAHGKVIRHDKLWRKAKPLVLAWRADAGETGPWKIEIGKVPDLSDARIWYFRTVRMDKITGREISERGDTTNCCDMSYTVPRANLEVASEYYWRVTSRGRCGFSCWPRHGCKESRRVVSSAIGSFHTEDLAPRWIELEGDVGNFRDLGGRRTEDGRRVKQSMAYRGQGLNSNSVTGEEPGLNRLTVNDSKYLSGVLGIRTDLDLRGEGETAGLSESPLGSGVKLIKHPSQSYKSIFSHHGKKTMARNFRVFCNRKNYPIYFHCIGGADRTGALAYVLNGVLGVNRHDIETDWESTFYPNIPFKDAKGNLVWNSELHFNNGFAKYGNEGDSWNRRIELYLLDCGVTEDEIAAFRAIMLEPSQRTNQ